MGFVGRGKLVVFNKTFYNNEDIVVVDIVNRISRFK